LGPAAQRVHRLLQRHPELVLGSSSVPLRLLLLDLVHGREEQLGSLDTNNAHRHVVVVNLVRPLSRVRLEVLHGLGREPDRANTVHWRRRRALLEVTWHTVPRLKLALTSLCNHLRNHLDTVCLRGLLVDQDDLARPADTLILLEHGSEMVNVAVQHLQVDAILGCVDSQSSNAESRYSSDVARLATLSLNDEDTATRRRCTLSARIRVLDQCVQACIGSNRVLGSWDVVRDCGGNDALLTLVECSWTQCK
jgi:hypothetical protein